MAVQSDPANISGAAAAARKQLTSSDDPRSAARFPAPERLPPR
jgi:hypothetical protein